MKIGYLGPEGSHSYEALEALMGSSVFLSSCAISIEAGLTLTQLLTDLTHQKLDAVLVPMENALEGVVTEVMDRLALESKMPTIQLELTRNIQHRLIRKKEGLSGIQTVVSHLQAIAQSRDALTQLLGSDIIWVPAPSTSKAVEMLVDMDENTAALGTLSAAKANSYYVVLDDAAQNPNNQTCFVLLSGHEHLLKELPSTIKYKTSICVSPKVNGPGVLLDILECLKSFQLNMTKIQSRPTKRQLGEYMFLIDFEGKAPETFYTQLNQTAASLKVLGEYPCLGVI